MEELVFTPAAVLDLLSSIEELKDYDIDVYDSGDKLTFTIGGSQYDIKTSVAEDVEVPEEVIEEVAEINEENYEPFQGQIEEDEPVEGGLIKELIKTLAIGGLVRLTKNAISKA